MRSNRTFKQHIAGLLRATVVVAIFAVIGVVALRSSSAVTYQSSMEAEVGTLSGNAEGICDPNASGKSAVTFGTPAPSPIPAGMPNASNTGYPGYPNITTLTPYTGPTWDGTNNLVIDGYLLCGSYHFAGNGVIIRNSKITAGVGFSGDNIRIENCEIVDGISLSGVATGVVQRNNIHGFTDDGTHITSDTGQVQNITYADNYVHNPTPGAGAHADGMQVRGVRGLTLTHNTMDMGPWRQVNGQDVLNAALFLQDANGGNSDVTVDGNYLNGGGYIFYLGIGLNTKVTNNRFGPDGHYGFINNTSRASDITAWSGNVKDANNEIIPRP